MTTDFGALKKLLKACKVNGVTELKVGDIEVKFGEPNTRMPNISASEIAIPTTEQLKDAEADAALGMNLSDAEDELAHMQVENPALYEELLVQRELQDGGGTKKESFD